ncbi:MAG: PaaI family thioesterase [Phascolarctobacterium sp.]|nr:PaaI family thioesterase [Phascolarctobacterium sp.]
MSADEITTIIKEIYEHNAFMKHCGIEIISLTCGEATVGLTIDANKHTNINNKPHGGLIMTLMDNATGLAAATVGKRVVTMSTTVNFVKSANVGDYIEATAYVESMDENNLIYLRMEVRNKSNNQLMATAISSMLSIANFGTIPEKW